MKFTTLAAEVLAQRAKDGVRGLDRELSRYRCHIENEPFASRLVTEISARDVREWRRTMTERDALGPGRPRKLSRQTISRCQSLISAILTEAVERELIVTNPCAAVKSPRRVDESDTREKWAFLTVAEQAALAACAGVAREDRVAIRFAIGTGLRQGEHRHLELVDLVVDGDDPRVVVRYAGRRKDTGEKLPPKSGKVRTVPLFGDGLAAARDWLALLPEFCPKNPQGLAFPTALGRLRQQGKFLGRSDTLRKHYRAAGIVLRPHLHWHALRHTFGTNLVTGVLGRFWRLEEIQVAMGHSSIMITQRYAHVGEDAIRRAARETVAAQAAQASAQLPLPLPPPVPVRQHILTRGALIVRGYLAKTTATIARRLTSTGTEDRT